MAKLKELAAQLNIFKECQESRLRLFECPPMLFVTMGVINILSMAAAYFIGSRYFEEGQIIVLVATLSVFIITIGYLIIKGFDRIASANRLKSDFLNIATHQLLTPLSSISWITETLLSKKIESGREKTIEYLEMIRASSRKMVKLISDLLDTNKIEEGKIQMQPEAVDLYKATEEAVNEVIPKSEFQEASVTIEKTGDDFKVFIDPVRLRMVIQNLTDNALKYSVSKKDIGIKIFKNTGGIKFEIEDKGIGINEAEKYKIFQKFSRADNTKFLSAGSGLGLFIAKFVIEKAGGAIGFESKEGQGSKFWFALPEYKPR